MLTMDDRRELIDELAKSISRLCHTVIARRLSQFFEVIGEEVAIDRARLLDALNQEPGESLTEWAMRAKGVRDSIKRADSASETPCA